MKTLGQIAYEAWGAGGCEWDELREVSRVRWELSAAAVEAEVNRRREEAELWRD